MIDLYPAIDLLGGRVVRLRQGVYDDQTIYGDDPIGVARGFAAAGATWIHVVDLDAARSGGPINRPVVAAIAEAVGATTKVQTGGGVRTLADVDELAASGVTRVVMGSAAVADPELVRRASERLPVAVGLDHRDGVLAVSGWTESSGIRLDDAYALFPTAEVFVITDIGRDGMLRGPDIDGLTRSVALAGAPVIASGGVAGLDDIAALARVAGLGGIITGKAVYEGRLTVRAALDLLRGRTPGASA
jgi:phosphoribosylformimino-5-aminoimidazole carboxamide ribotide isomerase